MPEKRLLQQLNQQLNYLRVSAREYDAGNEAEAIRAATTLRVLFHNTGNSTSLLRQLGMDGGYILSGSSGRPQCQFVDHVGFKINTSSLTPSSAFPMLGKRKLSGVVLTDWWEKEVVYSFDTATYYRKNVVLTAANQDGGAHVDPELDEFYAHIASGTAGLGITANLTYNGPAPFEQGKLQNAQNIHLAMIRQFTHEVLETAARSQWERSLRSNQQNPFGRFR